MVQRKCVTQLWVAIAIITVLIPLPALSQALKTLDGRLLVPSKIDQTIQHLLVTNQVTGLAVALINHGRVTYIKTYGQRDKTRKLPLTTNTVLYAASLTKSAFGYMIMQLVDEGRINLDRSIADYLPQALPDYPKYADLGEDPRWKQLTFRILLSHQSGFQNFRWLAADGKLRFYRNPGTRFGYSGEGINLSQFVLEKGLGIDVQREMQRRVFNRFGMTRTSLVWRPDFADNYAQGYQENGSLQEHDQRENVRAAGSIDTTITDWANFLAGVSRGEGLSRFAHAEMVKRQVLIDSPQQFPTLLPEHTEQWKKIALGYGIGWGIFRTPFGDSYFKEGHDDGTANYSLCLDHKQSCILLMSNSVRAEGIFTTLVNELLGPVNLPWQWESYAPAADIPNPKNLLKLKTHLQSFRSQNSSLLTAQTPDVGHFR